MTGTQPSPSSVLKSPAHSGSAGGPQCPRASAAAARRSGRGGQRLGPGAGERGSARPRRRPVSPPGASACGSSRACVARGRWRPRTPRSRRAPTHATRRCRRRRRRAKPCAASLQPRDQQRAADLHHQPPCIRSEPAANSRPPPARRRRPDRGLQRAQHLRHALAGHARHQHHVPPGRAPQRRASCRRLAGVIASVLLSATISGFSASPAP